MTTHNKYSNQVYHKMLIINNKQTLIRYLNASSSVIFYQNGKTEYNHVNILSIIATLLPSAFRHRCRCWSLVVVVGVLLTPAASFCLCCSLQYLTTHNKYSNQVYHKMLIINNKQTLIRYLNASSSVIFYQNGKTEYNHVNILSIIATLLPSAFRHRCRCWSLVVVVGVLLTPAASFCLCCSQILVVFVGVSSSFMYCTWRQRCHSSWLISLA